ncbi:hypothetical protein B0J11DRAFT_554227 [Dendryphion nanum]|uniref:NmrA-like domain-containing protein n=1 Tax=Dendryphion nanum TaxID=256645 RepID=A0A9P9D3N1_9PLEO|nr:hypothetical protein B0J11DRAFT_554227 [Dendryphion nanum]
MSKNMLAVFAASGNQGTFVANFVSEDKNLSKLYTALEAKGEKLVQADLDDPSSLELALEGVKIVLCMTATQFQGNTHEPFSLGVAYIVSSSMPHARKISNGELQIVDHFDDKAEIEQYIRSLPVKSAFFAPASFMQNVLSLFMRPVPSLANEGTYLLANCARGNTEMPFIDITEIGQWYEGKFFAGAGSIHTLDETADIASRVTCKTVRHQQWSDEIFKQCLPKNFREQLNEMWVLQWDYGCFGSQAKELVDRAKDQIRGEVIGLEEFLVNRGYKLD